MRFPAHAPGRIGVFVGGAALGALVALGVNSGVHIVTRHFRPSPPPLLDQIEAIKQKAVRDGYTVTPAVIARLEGSPRRDWIFRFSSQPTTPLYAGITDFQHNLDATPPSDRVEIYDLRDGWLRRQFAFQPVSYLNAGVNGRAHLARIRTSVTVLAITTASDGTKNLFLNAVPNFYSSLSVPFMVSWEIGKERFDVSDVLDDSSVSRVPVFSGPIVVTDIASQQRFVTYGATDVVWDRSSRPQVLLANYSSNAGATWVMPWGFTPSGTYAMCSLRRGGQEPLVVSDSQGFLRAWGEARSYYDCVPFGSSGGQIGSGDPLCGFDAAVAVISGSLFRCVHPGERCSQLSPRNLPRSVFRCLEGELAYVVPSSRGSGSSKSSPVPFAVGKHVAGRWTLRVSRVTPKADRSVLAANMFNERPKHGTQFFLVNVSAKYNGPPKTGQLRPTKGHLDPGFTITATGASGTTYSSLGCGVLPAPDLTTDPAVASGRKTSGNVCFEVSNADARSLLLVYQPPFGAKVWFALRR
jgi:hypothetical protein